MTVSRGDKAMPAGLFPAAEAWFNSGVPDYFPGQTTAGFNRDQQAGWANSLAASKDMANRAQWQSDAYLGYMGQGPQWNPYLDQVAGKYSDQMARQFNERIMPNLRGGQVATNAAGSSAAGIAQAQAVDDQQRTVSDQLANLYARGFSDTQNRYVNTLGQGPSQIAGWNAAMMQPGAVQQQMGGMQQALQQKRLDDEMKRWAYYRDMPQQRLQTYSGLLGNPATAGAGTTSTTANTSTGTNWMNSIAGGLAYAAPAIRDYFNQGNSSGWNSPLGNPASGSAIGNIFDQHYGPRL